jgi:serine/threonine protein phosphatase 1
VSRDSRFRGNDGGAGGNDGGAGNDGTHSQQQRDLTKKYPHNHPMFQNITKIFRKTQKQHVHPHVPKNQRIYSIGDIHGRADLLSQLHDKIKIDADRYEGKKTIVYLGDYVDRGEQSKQVIDILLNEPLEGFESIHLKGNHEQAMLDFIAFPGAAAAWLTFGGRECLNSYGIPLAHIPSMNEVAEIAQKLDDKLPDDHRAFMTNSLHHWQCGSYYFVHAGIRPGIALENQSIEDLLWIRADFLGSTLSHGVIVVHGHSISMIPELLPNRIGIDTGAFSTGVLTALVLEDEEQRLLQTGEIIV